MPSPIAHAAAGYAIYKLYATPRIGNRFARLGALPGLLILTVILALVPDFDFAVGLLAGDFDRFHNAFTNSLLVGPFVALVLALALRWLAGASFGFWFWLALLAYEAHVIMDYLGAERGVMLFWPVTAERFISPVQIFYGLHRSGGLINIQHLWTFLTETAFAAAAYALVHLARRRADRPAAASEPAHE